MYFLLFLYMYLQETYVSCFPSYAFTIPTSPGTQGQVENTQEGQHQFDVLPATASIPWYVIEIMDLHKLT